MTNNTRRLNLTLTMSDNELSELEKRVYNLHLSKASYVMALIRNDINSFETLGLPHQPPEEPKQPKPISIASSIMENIEQMDKENENLGLPKRRAIPLLEKRDV